MTENKPSWERKIPNCCQSCINWEVDTYIEHVGICKSATSLDSGEKTDSRYRCPSFQRKEGV